MELSIAAGEKVFSYLENYKINFPLFLWDIPKTYKPHNMNLFCFFFCFSTCAGDSQIRTCRKHSLRPDHNSIGVFGTDLDATKLKR